MNQLVVLGINYHSSPLSIRERFTIPESCLAHALQALSHMPHLTEVCLLSTCNRTEVYARVTDINAGLQEIESFFLNTQAVKDHGGLRPNFRLLREDVALHLFRVASGLDSMVLGEGQIMSQVKAAYQTALETGTTGPVLDQLFKQALSCGKRVRSETDMAKRAVSVSSAAVEMGREVYGSLKDRNICILGSGKMGQVCAKLLLNEQGSGKVFLLNRTRNRIDNFLLNNLPSRERLDVNFEFSDRHALASACDLVIVSTSSPSFILEAGALKNQGLKRPLCIIDISVPRNVDPEIGNLEGVTLYHADDLVQVVNKNLAQREALVADAEEIIFESLDAYHAWQRSMLVVPTITDLRQKIEAIRQEHMARNQANCTAQPTDTNHDRLEELSRAIVNQILHHPTVQLKATRDYEVLRQHAESLRTLFNLDLDKSVK